MPPKLMKETPRKAYLGAIEVAKRKGKNKEEQLSIFLTLIEPYNREWERRQAKQTSLDV